MRLTVRTAAALLAFATLVTYANSLGGAFVFDDIGSLVNNPTLREWRTALFPPGGGLTVSGRPLLNASFTLSHHLGGGAAWGHHVLNLAIHLGAGLALFGFVRRTLLLPRLAPRYGAHATSLAGLVALLWTLHPLQTESVTYLVQRAESQMGLLALLACYAYVRGAAPALGASTSSPRDQRRASGWLSLSVLACLLGIGTKEVTVAVPLLVLLHDRAFLAGTVAAALRTRRTYYLCLFGTWLPLAALVWQGGSRGGTSGFNVGITPLDYWLTQFEAIARYVSLIVWPQPLVFEYGTFWVRSLAHVWPAALLVTPLVLGTLWALWRRPWLGFIGGWFFALLAPTSLMPGTLQMIVEHRLYLSLAAALILAVLALHALLPRLALPLGLAIASAFAVQTAARNTDYRTDLRLWAHTVAARPANHRAHLYYANALVLAGRPAEAVAHYRTATNLTPTDPEPWANLSLALGQTGDFPAAITAAETALRLNPRLTSALGNLGLALVQSRRPAEALPHLEAALRLTPESPEVHNTLGVALIQLQRAPEAAAHFTAALRLRPDYPQARDNLARLRTLLAAPPR